MVFRAKPDITTGIFGRSLVGPDFNPQRGPLAVFATGAGRGGGFRHNSDTPKGLGFFGEIPLPGGGLATELTMGIQFNGVETEIPIFVPTLTKDEFFSLTNDIIPNRKPLPNAIAQKSVDFHRSRVAAGKSPFAEPDEVGRSTIDGQFVGSVDFRGDIPGLEDALARDATKADVLRQALFLPSDEDIRLQAAQPPSFAAADPTSLPDIRIQQRQAAIFSTPAADLFAAANIAARFPEKFPSDIVQQLREEANIKEELGFLKTMSSQDQAELIFKNQAGDLFGVQSFLSRKGLDPIDAFPGQRDIQIKASERLAQEFQQAFPGLEEASLIEKGAFRAGKLSRSIIEVTLTANALGITSKAGQAALKTLPQGARAAVTSSLILGGTELLQAPREGEEPSDRVLSVTGVTVFGAAAGKVVDFVLSPVVKGIQRLSDKAFVNRNPQFKNFSESAIRRMRADKDMIHNINQRAGIGEDVRAETVNFIKSEGKFLSDLQETLAGRVARFGLKRGPIVAPQRVAVPRGFRAGGALVPEEPIKGVAKAVGKAAKVAKEPVVLGVAKVFGGLTTGQEKISVQGIKDLPFGLGKVSPRRFVEILTTDVKFLKNRLAQEARVTKEAFKAGKVVERVKTTEVREKRDIAITEAKAKRIMQVTELRATTKITEATRKEARQIAKDLLPGGKERDKFFARIKNAKKPEDLVPFYDAVEQRFDALEKADAIDRVTKSVKKVEAALKKQRQKPVKGRTINPAQEKQLRGIIDQFSIAKLSEGKLRAADSLLGYMDNLKETFRTPAGELDVERAEMLIPKARRELLEQVTRKNVREMTTDDLNTIADSIDLLLHVNQTKNRIILDRKARDLNDTIEGMVKVTEAAKPARKKGFLEKRGGLALGKPIQRDIPFNPLAEKKTKNPVSIAKDAFIGELNHDVKTMANTMGGGSFNEYTTVFETDFIRGRSAEAKLVTESFDAMADTFEANNITGKDLVAWSRGFQRALKSDFGQIFRNMLSKGTGGKFGTTNQLTLQATDKSNGKDVNIKLTPATLMDIGMYARSTDGLKILFNDGYTTVDFSPVTFTPTQLKKALSGLTTKQIAVMDKAAETIRTQADAINEVSLEVDGIEKAKIDDYWHVDRLREKKLSGKGIVQISLTDNPGFLKDRTGSNLPTIGRDFFERYYGTTVGSGQYLMTPALRNSRTVINNQTLTDTINDQGFAQTRERMIRLLEKVQQSIFDESDVSGFFAAILRGKAKAVLTDPGIIASQYTSVVGYLTEIDPKFAPIALGPPKPKNIQRYLDNVPFYKTRVEGGLSSIALGDIAKTEAISKALRGKGNINNTLIGGIHKVDSFAVANAYEAAEAEIKAKSLSGASKSYWDFVGGREGLKFESLEYWEAVGRRGDFLVGRTQPMFTMEHRSAFTSTPSRLERSFVQFRSYVDQVIKMQARANTMLRNGQIPTSEWAQRSGAIWTGVAANTILRQGIKTVVFGARLTVAGLVAGLIAAPFKVIPFIGNIINTIITQTTKRLAGEKVDTRDVDFDTIATSAIETLGTSAKDLADAAALRALGEEEKADKKAANALINLVVELSELTGLPARDIKSFLENRILPEEPEDIGGAFTGRKGRERRQRRQRRPR